MAEHKSFEEQLGTLEQLVKKMEGGQLSLDELLSSYQQGMQMAADLDQALNQAEKTMLEWQDGRLKEMEDAP